MSNFMLNGHVHNDNKMPWYLYDKNDYVFFSCTVSSATKKSDCSNFKHHRLHHTILWYCVAVMNVF